MISLTLAILVVLVSSAFCSGTEAALFSVSMVKARKAQESKRYGARQLVQILENMNRPIATIVVLNNIANIVGSITIGALAAKALGSEWLGIFSGVLTLLIIIFSEIIPKTWGEHYSEQVALKVAPSILLMTRILSPVVWFLERITAPITRGKTNLTTNEGEIRLLAQIGLDEGVIEDDEAKMLQQVFKLNDTTAKDLMTPRIAMTYLNGSDALKDAKDREFFFPYFQIRSSVEVLGEFDDVRGTNVKRIHFYIEPLLVHAYNLSIPGVANGQSMKDFVHKTYNYVFTGENLDIQDIMMVKYLFWMMVRRQI